MEQSSVAARWWWRRAMVRSVGDVESRHHTAVVGCGCRRLRRFRRAGLGHGRQRRRRQRPQRPGRRVPGLIRLAQRRHEARRVPHNDGAAGELPRSHRRPLRHKAEPHVPRRVHGYRLSTPRAQLLCLLARQVRSYRVGRRRSSWRRRRGWGPRRRWRHAGDSPGVRPCDSAVVRKLHSRIAPHGGGGRRPGSLLAGVGGKPIQGLGRAIRRLLRPYRNARNAGAGRRTSQHNQRECRVPRIGQCKSRGGARAISDWVG
mmetsp:Transcript_19949/g.49525  ORF Transcript_19949/g.49525 Transcript_19949/m.49525 type:complete len:259 (+) Transcript_19949:738-1514(+)